MRLMPGGQRQPKLRCLRARLERVPNRRRELQSYRVGVVLAAVADCEGPVERNDGQAPQAARQQHASQ